MRALYLGFFSDANVVVDGGNVPVSRKVCRIGAMMRRQLPPQGPTPAEVAS